MSKIILKQFTEVKVIIGEYLLAAKLSWSILLLQIIQNATEQYFISHKQK